MINKKTNFVACGSTTPIKKIISFPYQTVHASRVLLYKLLGLYHKNKLPVPVISIGNISFGGTGKTPITIEIAKYFAAHGYKVTVLTRGYKAKNLGDAPVLINSKEQDLKQYTALNIGDEPCEMLEVFSRSPGNLSLAIGKNRYDSGLAAINKFGTNLFILDDGLQHISLDRNLDLVLKNVQERGFYREFNCAEKNADYLVYTKVDKSWLAENSAEISVAFNLSLTKTIDPKKQIGIFTGIANPQTFMQMVIEQLNNQGMSIKNNQIRTWFFPDHHQFHLDEVTKVLSLGINLITTRKDLVRIPEQLRSEFIVADLRLDFVPQDFLETLLKKIKT